MKVNYWHEFEKGLVYHVYNHAVSARNLYHNKEYYQRFLRKYKKHFHSIFHTYAFCLMPNHFHFVVKVKNQDLIKSEIVTDSNVIIKYMNNDIEINSVILDLMRRLHSGHSLFINKKYVERGQLLLKRTKRVSFNAEDKLKYLIEYVHHNPIHHGFKKSYGDWPFSSYNHVVNNDSSIIDMNEVLSLYKNTTQFKKEHQTFKIDYKKPLLNLD